MKSYEEMAQNVFKRGDEYFQRKKKRSAIIKKGAYFMSIFGIFALASLGLWSSNMTDNIVPDDTSRIAIVQTETETNSSTTNSKRTFTQTNISKTETFQKQSIDSTTAATSNVSLTATADTSKVNINSAQMIIKSTNDLAKTNITATNTKIETETNTTITTTLNTTETTDDLKTNDENCVVAKLTPGAGFKFITYYRGFIEEHPMYLWNNEYTDLYAVTAETYKELNNIKLPSDVAQVDLNAIQENIPNWSFIEQKYCLNELTDPYIIVKCSDSSSLYLMENVKAVYSLESFTCTSAATVENNSTNYVTVISSKDISLAELNTLSISNENIIIKDIQKVSELENGKKEYRIYFDKLLNAAPHSESSIIRHFDICKKLMQFDFIDTAYPSFMYTDEPVGTTYALTLVDNPYKDNSNASGTFGKGFSWTFNGNTLTFSADETIADSPIILTAEKDSIESMPWNRYLPHVRHLVFSDGITSLGNDFDSYFMNAALNLETITSGESFDWLNNAVLYGEKLRFEATFIAPQYSKTDWLTHCSNTPFVAEGIAEKPFLEPGNADTQWEYSEQQHIMKLRDELTYETIKKASFWQQRFDRIILEEGTKCSEEYIMDELIQLIEYPTKNDSVPIYCYPDFGYNNIQTLRSKGITVIVMNEDNSLYKSDVNFDGNIDISDAIAILSYYSKNAAGLNACFSDDEELNKFAYYLAHTSNNKKQVDIIDATNVLKYYAQKASGLNPNWDDIVKQ